MKMNKKTREALRFTPSVDKDVPTPSGFGSLVNGYSFNKYSGVVSESCSSSINHGTSGHNKTTTQRPICQYSTKLLALKALRNALEIKFAESLLKIDERIEAEG